MSELWVVIKFVWASSIKYKEFIMLVLIFISSVVRCVQEYVSQRLLKKDMQLQVNTCDGKFNLQKQVNETLNTSMKEARLESKEALSIVREVQTCTTTIKNTVDNFKRDFLDGKYGHAETKEN